MSAAGGAFEEARLRMQSTVWWSRCEPSLCNVNGLVKWCYNGFIDLYKYIKLMVVQGVHDNDWLGARNKALRECFLPSGENVWHYRGIFDLRLRKVSYLKMMVNNKSQLARVKRKKLRQKNQDESYHLILYPNSLHFFLYLNHYINSFMVDIQFWNQSTIYMTVIRSILNSLEIANQKIFNMSEKHPLLLKSIY